MPAPIVQEVRMGVMLFCFMGLTAGADLVRRKIPVWLLWLFGVSGAIGAAMAAVKSEDIMMAVAAAACSVAVGVVLLAVSRLVLGAIGEGDGWFFFVTGFYTTWKVNLAFLCYGLMLCCVYGMILMIRGRIMGVSVRKKRIPFLPFVWLAGMMMLAGNMWEVWPV